MESPSSGPTSSAPIRNDPPPAAPVIPPLVDPAEIQKLTEETEFPVATDTAPIDFNKLSAEEQIENFKKQLAQTKTKVTQNDEHFALIFATATDQYKGAVKEWIQARLEARAESNNSLLASFNRRVQEAETEIKKVETEVVGKGKRKGPINDFEADAKGGIFDFGKHVKQEEDEMQQ